MTPQKHWSSVSTLCSIFLLLPPGLCHMEMNWPYALRSKYNPNNTYDNIDYSMTSPLEGDGSNFPCKGYQNDRPIEPVVTYTPGSTYNMTLAGTTTHDGGSCQLSLSYDNGATFRVIHSMMGGCPLVSTYNFTIPSYAPAGDALLAWSWQNKLGNREFYMNCAEVSIDSGTTSRKQRRESAASFDELPYIWRANLEGLNDCATTEGVEPVYPDPGPEVEYGGTITSDSAPSPGNCDIPKPYGQTYQATNSTNTTNGLVSYAVSVSCAHQATDSVEAAPESTSSTTVQKRSVASTAPWPGNTGHNDDSMYRGPDINAQARVLDSTTESSYTYNTSPIYSTTTVFADCPDTVTLTIFPSPSATVTVTAMPSKYTTSAACTGSSASCPCAPGYTCDEITPCTWACNSRPTPTAFSSRSTWTHKRSTSWTTRTTPPGQRTTSTVVISRTYTVKPSSTGPVQPTNRPPYASGDTSRYLPCVPGTFMCTSSTTWQTCDWNNDGSAWIYGYARDVAPGTMCLTNPSPYSGSTDQHAQQALTPAGYYRDDRIVRDRPDGDCDVDGSILCTDGGQQFDVCDHGGWVRMGSVADGVVCEDGRIVASS